jgi:hypothetical protein
VARSAPPSGDGSPVRLIATMVGIVGILLLGSLAWSAVGALLSAMGSAASAISSTRPAATLGPPIVAVNSPQPVVTPTTLVATVTPAPTLAVAPSPTPIVVTPTAVVAARNPWILLPQPEPGSHVASGAVTVEARGRGDAPIKGINLELDGGALAVSLEQRSDSTWRGFANIKVSAGQHAVKATVTDADGRSGSFRWTFSAGP